MLDQGIQGRLGLFLRRLYDDMPKGEIPGRIWALLLALEREAALAEKAPRA